MEFLRHIRTRRIFTLIAGIIFLNLSFVVFEIKELGLSKKYQTLVQLVTNAGFEEEEEYGGEAGEADESTDKIEFALTQHLTHHQILFSIAQRKNKDLDNLSILPGHKENFSPPPEV